MLSRVKIINYKSYKDFSVDLNPELNIIVGDNEAGKSSLLEAINLVLTCQINGRMLHYELSPYFFNIDTVKTYLGHIQNGEIITPPSILIEIYFYDPDTKYSELKGTNNSLNEDAAGISLSVEFDSTYQHEYEEYLRDTENISTVPIEYYKIAWNSFADNSLTSRSVPLRSILIDTSTAKYQNGKDMYLNKILDDILEPAERAQLSIHYRKLKEKFSLVDSITSINDRVNDKKGDITDKELNISVDISSKSNWDRILTSYLDEVPFEFIGKGEQNSIKMKLALETSAEKHSILLIEEPENHLSLSNLNKLLNTIISKNENKQIIVTTHSSYIMNKLDIGKMLMLSNEKVITRFSNLDVETRDFFMKLPGYDTLRILLSQKVILVEGPSDDLILQKAYRDLSGKLPIEDGIDIFCVSALSFKRFIELSLNLQKEIVIVTDNDGDINKHINEKYEEYIGNPKVKICYCDDENYNTLEPNIVKANEGSLNILKEVFGHSSYSDDRLLEYMLNNKTKCALKLFETDKKIKMPEYILNAFK